MPVPSRNKIEIISTFLVLVCSLLLKSIPLCCTSELAVLEACGPVGVDDESVFPNVVGPLLTDVVVVGDLLPPTMLVQTPLHYCCHC